MSNETLTNLASAYRTLEDAALVYNPPFTYFFPIIIFGAVILGFASFYVLSKIKPIAENDKEAHGNRASNIILTVVGSAMLSLTVLYFATEDNDAQFIAQNRATIEMALEVLQIEKDEPQYAEALSDADVATSTLSKAANVIDPVLRVMMATEIKETLDSRQGEAANLKALRATVEENKPYARRTGLFAAVSVLLTILSVAGMVCLISKITSSGPVLVLTGLLSLAGSFNLAVFTNQSIQQSAIAELSPQSLEIAQLVVETYNKYQYFSSDVTLNPSNTDSLVRRQIHLTQTALVANNPQWIQGPQSHIEKVVSRWSQKPQS